jgi:flagellar hook assembly protein FlgD
MMQAALDLYDQSEANSVGLAWDAVGVVDPATSTSRGDVLGSTSNVLGIAPNPFEQVALVRFRLRRAGDAVLHVYDARGRGVRELIARNAPAGDGFVTWDGRDDAGSRLASGIYFVRLVGASHGQAVRVALLR